MGILAWIILGLIAGFIGSKLVNKTGEGLIMDIVLGVVGAVVGGFIFSLFGAGGVTGLNLYSRVVAVIGAVVVLLAYPPPHDAVRIDRQRAGRPPRRRRPAGAGRSSRSVAARSRPRSTRRTRSWPIAPPPSITRRTTPRPRPSPQPKPMAIRPRRTRARPGLTPSRHPSKTARRKPGLRRRSSFRHPQPIFFDQ